MHKLKFKQEQQQRALNYNNYNIKMKKKTKKDKTPKTNQWRTKILNTFFDRAAIKVKGIQSHKAQTYKYIYIFLAYFSIILKRQGHFKSETSIRTNQKENTHTNKFDCK